MRVKVRGVTYEYDYSHQDKPCLICGDIGTFTYTIVGKGRKAEITLCHDCLEAVKRIDEEITKSLK